MTIYVLMAYISLSKGNFITQEFRSKENCEIAAARIVKTFTPPIGNTVAICVEK